MQKIIAKCKKCGKQYRVARKAAGRRFKCKKCPSKVTVPLPEDSVAESGDEEDIYANDTEESEETPVPPPKKKKKDTKKKKRKRKKKAEVDEEEPEPDEKQGKGKPKKPISALVRRAKPGLLAQKRKLREGDPGAVAAQNRQKMRMYVGVGIGLVVALVAVVGFIVSASGPTPLNVRETNFFMSLDNDIISGAKSRASGQFLYALESYDKAVAHLEQPLVKLERCPSKYEAVLSADLDKLKTDRDELLEFMKLLEGVKGGDPKAMEDAAARAKKGEVYQRLSALLILGQQPTEETCKRAIIELAEGGSGPVKEKAVEFLKTKIASKEAVPHLKKDIDAGKDVEKSVRLLLRIMDPSVPPILAKVLVKQVENVPFTRDVLVELIGMDQQGLVDKSCLADLEAFAKATKSDKLRTPAQELIESLENAE